ncbi:hypothetical protein C0995_004867 [Termitomyces sp. Mi166|nr:hypothetical protein C0995_004867 [Termitomyces sp. Mi166\
MGALLSLVYLLLAISVVFLFKKWQSSSARPPYPPGPKPSLISGNARQLPTALPWLTYTEWAKEYGDIVHVRVYNEHVVILNNLKDANALLEKRSSIYSDRPDLTMVPLYGDTWRIHRRLYQQGFNKKETQAMHEPVQIVKVHELLQQFLVAPEDFITHFRNVAGAIVMATVYDKNMSNPTIEKFVTLSEQAVFKLSDSVFPGAMLVNALPILRHIPAWFPGAGFHTFAADCRQLTSQMLEVPFQYVKDQMAAGIEVSSLTERLLKQNSVLGQTALREADLNEVVNSHPQTVSAAGTFIYAMLINTDAQRKAQDEIDDVVGRDRLPDFSDRPNLPYVEAVFREVMRWHPVLPLGVSHSTSMDDIYNGYFIPKGTTVVANIWSMTHDESRYPQPDLFKPERFFDENGELNNDDDILAFGFGRRPSYGSFDATFNIRKARDEQGNEIDPDGSYTDGLVSHKLPHACSITPRSTEARQLIIEANAEAQLNGM